VTSRTEVGLNSYHSFHTGSTQASKWTGRGALQKETVTARLLLYVLLLPPTPPKKRRICINLEQVNEGALQKETVTARLLLYVRLLPSPPKKRRISINLRKGL